MWEHYYFVVVAREDTMNNQPCEHPGSFLINDCMMCQCEEQGHTLCQPLSCSDLNGIVLSMMCQCEEQGHTLCQPLSCSDLNGIVLSMMSQCEEQGHTLCQPLSCSDLNGIVLSMMSQCEEQGHTLCQPLSCSDLNEVCNPGEVIIKGCHQCTCSHTMFNDGIWIFVGPYVLVVETAISDKCCFIHCQYSDEELRICSVVGQQPLAECPTAFEIERWVQLLRRLQMEVIFREEGRASKERQLLGGILQRAFHTQLPSSRILLLGGGGRVPLYPAVNDTRACPHDASLLISQATVPPQLEISTNPTLQTCGASRPSSTSATGTWIAQGITSYHPPLTNKAYRIRMDKTKLGENAPLFMGRENRKPLEETTCNKSSLLRGGVKRMS
uniref:Uncharacterized protein n=1 Tax=Timema bartmani TaxID=61472 RepID=A0A7R9EWB0_9NEOP|nr:unnamed protein product [Timema bartmani]